MTHSIIVTIVAILLLGTPCKAQNPIANRVKAAADNLPEGATAVAKYTDPERHCLYYILSNRLYKYDVQTNTSASINLSSMAYKAITNTYIVKKGKFIFVTIDCGRKANQYSNNLELWRIDTENKSVSKINDGYSIEKRKGCFLIKRITRTSSDTNKYGKYDIYAADYYYKLDGKNIWPKDEYILKQ